MNRAGKVRYSWEPNRPTVFMGGKNVTGTEKRGADMPKPDTTYRRDLHREYESQ